MEIPLPFSVSSALLVILITLCHGLVKRPNKRKGGKEPYQVYSYVPCMLRLRACFHLQRANYY